MTRPLAVLRPEPGNARTAARIADAGGTAIRLPLFAVVPVAWQAPDPAAFDALLVTSANAMRLGGAALARLAALPVHAVGAATAEAARAAGFRVVTTGGADAATLVAGLPPQRLLHLAGRERVALPGVTAITVYAADPLPLGTQAVESLAGSVALLHSVRAARRLAVLVPPAARAAIRLAALGPAIAAAAGDGWAQVAASPHLDDAALVALALHLAD
ncbi:hypothetical protein GCM10011380_31120 [Sphingomonas metalli]|uniref:Tetrapyrrole biosynthesis uroporphyrinogen III synthase domain-containing protein n=1 Tax=Sphingomonas metalli TaxID=1779358 RepID=A0A916WYJ1_9SPHN|nr:uroporphyrinogen-III synthase [Sphingomonas metalli]GGB39399.1 hypothetical protein GCM10011380_31120 [Sphingomonas metalli]